MRTELGTKCKAIVRADRAEARLEEAAREVRLARAIDLFAPLANALRLYRIAREWYACERVTQAIYGSDDTLPRYGTEAAAYLAPWPAEGR